MTPSVGTTGPILRILLSSSSFMKTNIQTCQFKNVFVFVVLLKHVLYCLLYTYFIQTVVLSKKLTACKVKILPFWNTCLTTCKICSEKKTALRPVLVHNYGFVIIYFACKVKPYDSQTKN